MSRLIIVVMALVVLGAVLAGALSLLRRAADAQGGALSQSRPGGALMRKVSFLILLSLIVYVSLWGGV